MLTNEQDTGRIDIEIENGDAVNQTETAAEQAEVEDVIEDVSAETTQEKTAGELPEESVPDQADMPASEDAEDWQGRYLRLAAEFDNFRKRTAREKQQLSNLAKESVLQVLFPAIDDLYRASEVAQKADNPDKIREGIELTLKKLTNALKKQEIYRIEAKGEKFDSEIHEAIATHPAPSDEQKGTVLEVLEHGYLHGEKVIRYAKVVTGE